MASDPYNLARFVHAQEPVYSGVLNELRRGRKQSHWMWFIFPQIEGLGHSPTAKKFAIASRAEAEAYLAHPILGPRLRECTTLLVAVEDGSINEVLGYPDDLKFRSAMTLFAEVADDGQVFRDALLKFFEGKSDPLTLERLRGGPAQGVD